MPQTAMDGVQNNLAVFARVWIPIFRTGGVDALVSARGPRDVRYHYYSEQAGDKQRLKCFHGVFLHLFEISAPKRGGRGYREFEEK